MGTVKIRIKRLGSQWSSVGVPFDPPSDRKGEQGIQYLCTKLVPGQVVELPDTHPILRSQHIEIVKGPEKDEFMRPWVFNSVEDAIRADPSKMVGLPLNADVSYMAEGATMSQAALVSSAKRRANANG